MQITLVESSDLTRFFQHEAIFCDYES